jgi:predicted DNA-binding mobile mystery protein A
MTTGTQRNIARTALDQRLEVARRAAPAFGVPKDGWVRAIRDTLGISSAILGQRLGLEASSLRRLEANERDGVVQLDTLARAANALGCDLVYALVPRRSLEDTVMDRALQLAATELATVDHTMALEDQSVGVGAQRVRLLARELVDRGQVTWHE